MIFCLTDRTKILKCYMGSKVESMFEVISEIGFLFLRYAFGLMEIFGIRVTSVVYMYQRIFGNYEI